jgi:hypothetical protein
MPQIVIQATVSCFYLHCAERQKDREDARIFASHCYVHIDTPRAIEPIVDCESVYITALDCYQTCAPSRTNTDV